MLVHNRDFNFTWENTIFEKLPYFSKELWLIKAVKDFPVDYQAPRASTIKNNKSCTAKPSARLTVIFFLHDAIATF